MSTPSLLAAGPRRGSLVRRRPVTASLVKRLVIYIRASTKDQRLTLEAQEHEARRWAESEGLEVAAVFIEPGVSGSSEFLKRPQAKAALAFMEQHGVQTIMAFTLDRMFRNTLDMQLTFNVLLDRGYVLRIAKPDLDLRGAMGKMFALFLGALAEFELAQRSERQVRGFDSMRRERIARTQNAPYGWNLGPEIEDRAAHSGRPYRALLPNPAEQTILREIIRRYQAGETFRAIASDLNHREIPTKLSGQWHHATVKSVIEHADLDDPEQGTESE